MVELIRDYPWVKLPLVVGAPMRLIALSSLASAVSNAHGIGFIGAGSDVTQLADELEKVKTLLKVQGRDGILPIGVGFLLWAGDKMREDAIPIIEKYRPAAVWLFAPKEDHHLSSWTSRVREATQGLTKIWIQVGTVSQAREAVLECRADVLVVQGSDAGGHGLIQNASIVSLLPEVDDQISRLCEEVKVNKPTLIAAGGIMDGRGCAAALALGASGVTLGTRLLATQQANIAAGYRDAIIDASDGGVSTARGKLYDSLRGTTDWPDHYGGRGVLNNSWHDHHKGMSFEENKRLHGEALKKGDAGWGENGRLTTYAGTAVGLAVEVHHAGDVIEEVRSAALKVLKKTSNAFEI